jgi:ketosteroid isomerase-like protein
MIANYIGLHSPEQFKTQSTMKTKIIALLGATTLFLSACVPPVQAPTELDMEKVRAEIQALENAYSAGEAVKDADAIAAYYSVDAVSYNRDEEPTVGRQAIRNRIAARIAADSSFAVGTYNIVDLYAEGNMVVEIGSWTNYDSSGAETDSGFYISYFELRDGKYLCVRDMNIRTKTAASMPAETADAEM